jgi:membrane-associated phospholipid phosphatase
MSTAVYGGFALMLGATQARPARVAVIGSAAALIIGMGISRVMLHSHNLIEVAVGLSVGIAALAIIILPIVVWSRPERLPIGRLAAAALLVTILFHGARWSVEEGVDRLAGWLNFLRPWCS